MIMSSIINDRVVNPLDHAVYWIEYVIRHQGLHINLATLNMNFFQIYMIDIALALTCLFFVVVKLICLCQLKKKNVKSKPKEQ